MPPALPPWPATPSPVRTDEVFLCATASLPNLDVSIADLAKLSLKFEDSSQK